MNDLSKRIFVAGDRGMVGSAIVRNLKARGYQHIITKTHLELDLTNQGEVNAFFATERLDEIYLAAAKVGGIHANSSYPADFLYINLMIEANVIHAAYKAEIRRLLFLGSSCIYPRDCPQPIREDYLLSGPLEVTNEPYAIAKIAGLKLCESYNRQFGTEYISVMPTNLYGPNDNYDLNSSHVLPALIRKAHEAKFRGDNDLIVWGSGQPRREFMHVDDMADACVFVMQNRIQDGWFNVGTGRDITIAALATKIMDIVGLKGSLRLDTSKPDGTPQKLLDVSKLTRLGWESSINLDDGLRSTYEHYKNLPVSMMHQ